MLERCVICDEPTGRAGRADDSIYCPECNNGPFCESCCYENGICEGCKAIDQQANGGIPQD